MTVVDKVDTQSLFERQLPNPSAISMRPVSISA